MGCIPLSENQPKTPQVAPWRNTRHEIIFEADTKAGKTFDIVLIVSIFLSIIAVTLDSVEWFNSRYASPIHLAEWCFTILFTIEYILRLISGRQPLRYTLSFFGILDLLATTPMPCTANTAAAPSERSRRVDDTFFRTYSIMAQVY